MGLRIETLAGATFLLIQKVVAIAGAAVAATTRDDDRQLHDSDLIGEYNYRTERLDAGNDPYGWYDED
jgi:hypothetical protein